MENSVKTAAVGSAVDRSNIYNNLMKGWEEFAKTLEDFDTPPELGVAVIEALRAEHDDDLRTRPDLAAEWTLWKDAALAGAKLNGTPHATDDEIGDVYARFFMRDGGVENPRYNACNSMMKFAMHQIFRAFAATRESDAEDAWRRFSRDTAKRVGFDADVAVREAVCFFR
jgi:hypothetical protein